MLFSDIRHGPRETIVTELRDYPDWHRGRLHYGVWIVPIDDPSLLHYIASVQRRLDDLLHPGLQRQPHLTVFVCGFEQHVCTADDDFSLLQRRAQTSALHRVRGRSCRLPLAAPDSFASAAFIPVGDPEQRLARWREVLGREAREVRQAAYVPHITLGLYRQKVMAADLRRRLSEIEPPSMPLNVESLHYATYHAHQQWGPLESRFRLTLDA